MAEGGNVPELGGYDYEFTSRVPEDRKCPVCRSTMKDPVQIVGCGHRLCKICMESWLRRPSPTCPVDRQPLSREKIFPDAACHREILDFTVKCPHFGCSWTGELCAAEEHQSECPFKVVKCPNPGCTEKLIKQDLHGHMTFECFWRKTICEYCQESFIVIQEREHFSVCPKFPVQCTNNCGLREIPRDKLDVHVRDECPATEIQCEYKNLGCGEVFPRSNAKNHSETRVESHLNLALRGLDATQLQVNELVSLMERQSQQIQQQSQ
ncbi:TNF receptor-associated factor 5-like isoform X1 [Oculina patagonica]